MKNLLKGTTILTLSLFFYNGNILGQTVNQTDDENGLVVIEAENYSDQRTATDGSSWELVTEPTGYSGTGAMQATHADNENFTAHKDITEALSTAPVLKYKVNFVKAETVYIWAKTTHVASSGYDDSVWPGLDGAIVAEKSLTYNDTNRPIDGFTYINDDMDGNRVTADISSVGEHDFELYFRETNLIVDQVILTTNADYDPNTAAPTAVKEYINNSAISHIYPNPVQGSATINYTLNANEFVSIKIFNAYGQEIETLVNISQVAGDYSINWDAKGLSSGLYFYQIRVGNNSATQKFIIH